MFLPTAGRPSETKPFSFQLKCNPRLRRKKMLLRRAVLDPKMNPSKWALGRGRNFGMGRDCLGRFLAQLHTHTHTARTKAPQGNFIRYSGIYSNKLESKYHSIYYGCLLNTGAPQVVLVAKNPPANAGDAGDVGSIPGSGRSPGGGHGNPLQYSCLENSKDRGAWWAPVHGVAKSRRGLKRLSTR